MAGKVLPNEKYINISGVYALNDVDLDREGEVHAIV